MKRLIVIAVIILILFIGSALLVSAQTEGLLKGLPLLEGLQVEEDLQLQPHRG